MRVRSIYPGLFPSHPSPYPFTRFIDWKRLFQRTFRKHPHQPSPIPLPNPIPQPQRTPELDGTVVSPGNTSTSTMTYTFTYTYSPSPTPTFYPTPILASIVLTIGVYAGSTTGTSYSDQLPTQTPGPYAYYYVVLGVDNQGNTSPITYLVTATPGTPSSCDNQF